MRQYTITTNLECHTGYSGQHVKIIKEYPNYYFDVMDSEGSVWHCGEEELTRINHK